MGVLPLTFEEGTSWTSLGLKGDETVGIGGLSGLTPRTMLTARIVAADGTETAVPLRCSIDTEDELDYYRNGGILPFMLRRLAAA
jgi:aconitate hydratase